MSKNSLKLIILGCLSPLLFVGCSHKNDAVKKTEPAIEYKVVMQEREEKKVYDPVMKDNSPTQRAVVDMGVVLKTRITSYKDNNHVLNGAHDVFFFAVQPDFVVTNSLPKEKSKFSHQGPIVDLSESKFVDTDKKVDSESRVLEREAEFDKKIDSFLNTQNGK